MKPSKIYSAFSDDERYEQTIHTIKALFNKGFTEVILIDNSTTSIDLEKLKRDSDQQLKAYHTPQYSFNNKGLNEALLILNHIDKLPESSPVFKISGRYYPNELFNLKDLPLMNNFDFIGVGEGFNQRVSYFSTRAYFVRNKQVLEQTLVLAIEEMLSYHKGVYGPVSLFKLAKSLFKKSLGASYQLSLEQAIAFILKEKKNFKLLHKINIDGAVAGFNQQAHISE
ncbi:hypothetical protein ACFQZX_15565 [Mucilaginibacter litoreus]|uniref:Glycosyl transferase family 2 n=1 Tax=Mucilaginibacter litoreus TaxID=1048221 RepID=A0ABW3AW65_9SPHI